MIKKDLFRRGARNSVTHFIIPGDSFHARAKDSRLATDHHIRTRLADARVIKQIRCGIPKRHVLGQTSPFSVSIKAFRILYVQFYQNAVCVILMFVTVTFTSTHIFATNVFVDVRAVILVIMHLHYQRISSFRV